jgi:hypothetical protein
MWSLLPLLVAVALFILAESTGPAIQLPAVALAVVLLTFGENLHSVAANSPSALPS